MADGRTNTNDPNDDTEQATESENGRGRSGEAIPAKGAVSNARYARESFKLTDRRRTDLRSLDRHATWREVYRACHVGVGVDD